LICFNIVSYLTQKSENNFAVYEFSAKE